MVLNGPGRNLGFLLLLLILLLVLLCFLLCRSISKMLSMFGAKMLSTNGLPSLFPVLSPSPH